MTRRRNRKEIYEYMDGIWDKVWWIRSISLPPSPYPENEEKRQLEMTRIEKTYALKLISSDWKYGYQSDISAVLHQVLEEEKDFLDTYKRVTL